MKQRAAYVSADLNHSPLSRVGKSVEITESSEGGSVPELKVVHRGDTAVSAM